MAISKISVFFLSIWTLIFAERPTKCPPGFTTKSNTCYAVFGINSTWIDAQSYCNTFGSDLLRVDTQQEMTSVQQLLQHVASTASFWLDANDMLTEGDWRYSGRNGDKIPYTHWASPGQPANSKGNEDCAVYRHQTGFWEAIDCTDKHVGVICEIALAAPDLVG